MSTRYFLLDARLKFCVNSQIPEYPKESVNTRETPPPRIPGIQGIRETTLFIVHCPSVHKKVSQMARSIRGDVTLFFNKLGLFFRYVTQVLCSFPISPYPLPILPCPDFCLPCTGLPDHQWLPVEAPGDQWRGGPVIPPGQRVPRLARHLPVAKHVPVRDWN